MHTILIIDDHQDFRQAVARFLKVNNIEANLLEASTADEGVKLANLMRPTIVLMDFCLSGFNSGGAADQIKASLPACNIILLTTFDLKHLQPLKNRELIKACICKNDLGEKLVPHIIKILNSESESAGDLGKSNQGRRPNP